MTALAELLDRLNAEGRAFLGESEHDVTASNLNAHDARTLLELSGGLNLSSKAYDTEGTEWRLEELTEAFEPFRLSIRKPEPLPNAILLLTSAGFSQWLTTGHTSTYWYVAGLSSAFCTYGRVFVPWGAEQPSFDNRPVTKSPRSLVREYGAQRQVVADIRPWLTCEDNLSCWDDSAFKIWATASIYAVMRAFAEEIDSNDHSLKFKGPPKLSLELPNPQGDVLAALGRDGFDGLQHAAKWVFENEREAEMRHILLATELARSGGANEGAINFFKDHICAALEGAKIAYQMSLSELGRDTLKVLADLRKAVTEETTKVTDTSRQLVTAVAGALAVGLGLIAARLTTSAQPLLIIAVMAVVALYILVIIASGFEFISLQRELREDWKQRLYRFLPQSDYERMVAKPAAKAARAYRWVAIVSGIAVATLTIAVILNATFAPTHATQTTQDNRKTAVVDADPKASKRTKNSSDDVRPPVEAAPEASVFPSAKLAP